MSTCPRCSGRSTKKTIALYKTCAKCYSASHPRPKKVSVDLRRQVWNTYSGCKVNDNKDEGRCFVCDDALLFKNFVCAHVVASVHNGPCTIDNLRPTCSSCNLAMGTCHLLRFKENFQRISEITKRITSITKERDDLWMELQRLKI